MSHPPKNLIRRQLIGAAAATFFLTVSRVGFANSSQVVAVRVWPSSTYTRVTIEAAEAIRYKHFSLPDPHRLVIDLEGLQLSGVLQDIGKQIQNADPFIQMARAGQFNSNTVRLVLDLRNEVKPQIFSLQPIEEYKHRLVIDLYPANAQQDDPLLALLQDYNKGQLNQQAPLGNQNRADKNRVITIVIDPGHGGEDPGAVGPSGTKEKDIVLQISQKLKRLIDGEKNMRAHLTRNEDVFIPLGVRVAKARKLGADLFISVHADAVANRTANGSSVFALSENGATSSMARLLAKSQNDADLIGGVKIGGKDKYLAHTLFDLTQTATINDSLKLGKAVLGHMGKLNRLHKAQVEQAGFAVLKAPDIPSILVETAFISNYEEEKKLLNGQFQQQMADAIMTGVKQYFAQGAVLARN